MKAMSVLQQRLLALALLLVCIAAAWLLVVLPVINGFADRSVMRDDLLAAYARNDRMMAGIPAWRMEIKQQKKTQAPFALEAPSLEMGHEILSKRMSQTVLGVGGTILSTQRMRSQLPLNWIGEQSDLQLSISQLVQLLTRFQNEEPYVVVDFLSVGVIPPSQPDGLQSLAVRLAISAPLRVDSQPSRPRAVASHA